MSLEHPSKPSTSLLRAMITAFVFLTRLPMPPLTDYSPKDSGGAFPLFPLIGLVIGGLITGCALLLNSTLPADVVAAVIVIVWALVTGGLHLDGLGDSADGWLAGGDKDRTLAIMKDSHSGSAAVIMIGCVLLLKFAALSHIISSHQWWLLILAPMLARASAIGLFLTTPYASPAGIANDFLQHASRTHMSCSVFVAVLISFILLPFTQTLIVLAAATVCWLALRALMMKRLGGTTGDTSGATIEILEAVILTAALI